MSTNKYTIRLLPLAALLLAACGDGTATGDEQEEWQEVKPEPITFCINNGQGEAATTRGSMVRYLDDMDKQDMAVIAHLKGSTSEVYFSDKLKHVSTNTDTGVSVWTTEQSYYWPLKSLDFYARAPYTDDARSNETYNSFDYTAQTDNDKQQDQMYAVTLGKEKGDTVTFNMKHALAAIGFNANTTSNLISVTVKGIDIYNVAGTGSFAYPTLSTTSPTTDTETDDSPVGTWTNVAGRIQQTAGITETQLAVNDQNITTEDGAILIIPQTLTGWKLTDGEATATTQTGAYLVIHCRLVSNGMYFSGTETTFGDVYVPFEGTFEAGKHYTFTLTFGLGYTSLGTKNEISVKMQATVTDWVSEALYFDKKIL